MEKRIYLLTRIFSYVDKIKYIVVKEEGRDLFSLPNFIHKTDEKNVAIAGEIDEKMYELGLILIPELNKFNVISSVTVVCTHGKEAWEEKRETYAIHAVSPVHQPILLDSQIISPWGFYGSEIDPFTKDLFRKFQEETQGNFYGKCSA